MARKKFSGLAEMFAVDVADDDLVVLVDVSAGVAKRMKVSEFVTLAPGTFGAGAGGLIWMETPGGIPGEGNRIFTLSQAVTGDRIMLFKNGILMRESIDFALSDAQTIQFALDNVPDVGDSLAVTYGVG